MPKGKNPYVGPRAYSPDDRKDGRKFYGREREVEELIDLLLSERIVLLYAPSGAGKTSLINAELVPQLEEGKRFDVLPVVSLNRTLVAGDRPHGVRTNRYVYSAILCINDGLPKNRRLDSPDGTLSEYLDRIAPVPINAERPDSFKPQFLIFDQFEEVLTLDQTDLKAKLEFFTQAGEALRARRRWALFSMREDYVAALDPYVSKIHTRLRSTFRLDFLGKEEAKLAIRRPAKDAGVTFHSIAATKLVEDLSKVRVQRADGSFEEPRPGPYVEPVQLQVVCWQLWEKLEPEEVEIGRGHLKLIGDVDEALANYYAEKVKQAASATAASERVVRRWMDGLMTEEGIRVPVLRGKKSTRELDNDAIDFLVGAHLVRREERDNRTWYELAHDRLIEPILRSNKVWFETNLSARWELSRLEMEEYAPLAKGARRGVALCLGGGGLRAALFHLGAVRRLNELGVLSQLDSVSATGGGSILAAHLMKRLNPWPEPGQVIKAAQWEKEVAKPFRDFARQFTPGKSTTLFLRMLGIGSDKSIRQFWTYLEQEIIKLPLKEMPERPRFIFSATDLVFATNWVFEKSRMGDYHAGYVSPPPAEWTVARAVTASAAPQPYVGATPLDLSPAQLVGGKFEDEVQRNELVSNIKLGNGNNYDHLALEPVWRKHEMVLVSDGGSRVKPGKDLSLNGLLRYMAVNAAQMDVMRKGWLLSNLVSGVLQGTYWSVTRYVSEYEPEMKEGYSRGFVEKYLSTLRLDSDDIPEGEDSVLENHGYLMAEVGMRRRHAAYFGLHDAKLEVPHPKWMDEEKAGTVMEKPKATVPTEKAQGT